MVSRIQNRNPGYSENLFTQNSRLENNTLNSIDGATALKLDESYELEEEQDNSYNNLQNENDLGISNETEHVSNNIPAGVSIESASYIENSNLEDKKSELQLSDHKEEEFTPRLFSEDQSYQSDEGLESNELESHDSEQLFDQDNNEEEDFEIPAFLRKQKF